MTNVNEEVFLNKLYEVIFKLSLIAKTQSYRFKKEWDENLESFKEKPHLVRQIPVEKERFLTDIDYRIKVLNTVKLTFEDGVNSIKSLLNTLYHSYFNDSDIFTSSFTEQDQITLKYLVAKEILGNLIQYNQLDHKTVPLKYNILARTYLLIKFKGQRDTEILENLKKINIQLRLSKLKKIMEEIISDGFYNKTKKGRYLYYHLQQELALSEEGKITFNQTIRPLVDWPTLFYRSYYNVRELNVTVNGDVKYPDYLNNVLLKAATQGYVACHYIFNNLVRYYEKLKEE